tara:strand:+ start:623 stop:877 length:255 start_codon:yes stop_codon:yes gene_type:complete
MKLTKYIITIAIFFVFSSFSYTGYVEAADCSNYKVLSHKWNACKLGSKKYTPGSSDSGSKKKKKGSGFWKKIKDFGGENVGEEG